jgi:hypothetical protein
MEGREGFVVSRRFCDLRVYAIGLSSLGGGDKGDVVLDFEVSDEE